MNWLANFVRPKLRAIVGKKDVPDDFWHACPSCNQMIFHRDLAAALYVCGGCGHHLRMPSKNRLSMLFDQGGYQEIAHPQTTDDPLKFRDIKKYTERLRDARAKTASQDAAVLAQGEIGGVKAVVMVMNFDFMGGSMGQAVGEAFLTAARRAVSEQAALVAVCSSGGARMQEGILSLMQMPRTTLAVGMVKRAGLPYITVLTDPTTGGVSASFAMLGDVIIAEPGAIIGFAGARVIEETIGEKLPEGFQKAEYLLEHGMIDIVCPRNELTGILGRVLSLLTQAGSAPRDREDNSTLSDQMVDTGSSPESSPSPEINVPKTETLSRQHD